MAIRTILLFCLLFVVTTGEAQNAQRQRTARTTDPCPDAFDCHMGIMSSRGDSRKAIKAKSHEYTRREYIAQLGYIDTTFTSMDHFRNNAELGLVVLPAEKGCKVVSYEFGLLVKRGDMIGPYAIQSDSLYCNMAIEQALHRLKPNDKLLFDKIKMKCPSSDGRFDLKSVNVTIVTDSAYKKMLPQVR